MALNVVLWLQITSVNTSAAIRIAALAQQRGAVRNISFEDFTLVGVRGNAVDIDAYGQGDALADARAAYQRETERVLAEAKAREDYLREEGQARRKVAAARTV